MIDPDLEAITRKKCELKAVLVVIKMMTCMDEPAMSVLAQNVEFALKHVEELNDLLCDLTSAEQVSRPAITLPS